MSYCILSFTVDDLLPPEKREHMSLEEQLRILLDRMDYANSQKHGRRSKLAKQIKKEVIKVRRQLALQKGQSLSDFEDSKSELAGKNLYKTVLVLYLAT